MKEYNRYSRANAMLESSLPIVLPDIKPAVIDSFESDIMCWCGTEAKAVLITAALNLVHDISMQVKHDRDREGKMGADEEHPEEPEKG
jgi:hypothetical protein